MTLGVSNKSRAKIGICLLAGILFRSFIAPGLMLSAGADGFSLILCPGQNPALATSTLATGSHEEQRHHHHVAATPDSLEPSPDAPRALHAESLDSICAVWANSSVSASKFPLRRGELTVSIRTIPEFHFEPVRTAKRHHSRTARAPPLVSA